MTQVFWRSVVEKQLDLVPEVIRRKFRLWVALVEESGIREVRKHKGFHDEPLKGTRRGQRSVRLNRAYRGDLRGARNVNGRAARGVVGEQA